jgi:hypothetical protein
MKLKTAMAGIAVALGASSAMASPSCNSTTDWVSLGPPGLELFGKSFTSATNGTHHDCYTFSLSSSATSFGGVLDINSLFNKLDIDVTKVSLYRNSALVGEDSDPLTFSFASLLSGGIYTLMIDSIVTNDPGLWKTAVGYAGMITTIAAPVPEPALVALVLAGLVGVGAATARRGRA